MGHYVKGILGGFQGKVGTVIGSTWRGIDYMKSLAKKSNRPPTQSQIEHRIKFSLLARFIGSMSRLLMTSFKDSAVRMTGTNSAFAYNYNNAIAGTYPAFTLDYSKVLISKGQLHNAVNPTSATAGNGQLKISWVDNSGIAMANSDDKCIIVVYCPELNQAVYTTAGATRSAASDIINVGNFTGRQVETWVSFISSNGSDIASSIYTGQLTVS